MEQLQFKPKVSKLKEVSLDIEDFEKVKSGDSAASGDEENKTEFIARKIQPKSNVTAVALNKYSFNANNQKPQKKGGLITSFMGITQKKEKAPPAPANVFGFVDDEEENE